MNPKPADIFISNNTFENFSEEIYKLNGNFDFTKADMIALAEVYFEIYPDSHTGRDLDSVKLGYNIIRLCFVEKMLYGLSGKIKQFIRNIFTNINEMDTYISSIDNNNDNDNELIEQMKKISDKLQGYKKTIDEIPKSMIKERYIGAITFLFNVSYLFNMKLQYIKNNKS